MISERGKLVQKEYKTRQDYCGLDSLVSFPDFQFVQFFPQAFEDLSKDGIESTGHQHVRLFRLVWFYGISTFVGYLTPNPFLCK